MSQRTDKEGSDSLAVSESPTFTDPTLKPLRIVDLFAGCGGLTLGAAQASSELGRSLDIRLAVDIEPAAAAVYEANFPGVASLVNRSVVELFPGAFGDSLGAEEVEVRESVGALDLLMGGPPCQGHSNLNNHTRRNDPKNGLYLTMARAAEVLSPAAVLIENVPAILSDRFHDENVVDAVRRQLTEAGYLVTDRVVSIADFGVAQTRKRHLLLATRNGLPSPNEVLDSIAANRTARSLRWAIGDLVDAPNEGFDRAPVASADNLIRMQYLLQNDLLDLPNALRPKCQQGQHSYKSMYGRLSWERPAQTITSGFGSIGQGRYMHPERTRALTAHEAARIQGFPDYFEFDVTKTRAQLATMIGNAVPPQLGRCLVSTLFGAQALEE